jgi:hypothetical protein
VQKQTGLRGDYFMDKFGAVVAVMLGLASLGITLWRLSQGSKGSDMVLAAMYAAEVVGAAAIFTSRRPAMQFAFWVLTIRVIAGMVYMGVIHKDKLAQSTLGFPAVEALYCWVRVRALKAKP